MEQKDTAKDLPPTPVGPKTLGYGKLTYRRAFLRMPFFDSESRITIRGDWSEADARTESGEMKGEQAGWQTYPGCVDIDLRHQLRAQLRKSIHLLQKPRQQTGATVNLFSHDNRAIAPLSATDIPLVVQIRNARRYLPSFLAHYRKLGVTRFVVIDDGSNDSSADYLSAMKDVDLYTSDLSYMEAGQGILFKQEILRRYGVNRWWVFVDIDEYLTFEDAEQRHLKDLIPALERRGITRLQAPLLDMYPHGDVDAARFDGTDSTMPWEVAGAFDKTGYLARFIGKDWEIRGGMRHRVFKSWVELAKFPLIYAREDTHFRSIHYPRPAFENSVPILGNLLHFKIFDDYAAAIERAATEGRHFDDAKHYRMALDSIAGRPPSFFAPDVSEIFTGSKQLLDMGFFRSSI